MAIIDDISTLKTKEGTLTNNKVSNFAYDDDAFTNDNANGVSTYNYSNHNNIPVSDPSIIKVNPTIVAKGFRSQFSTLPRMLVNHFFGRISYNLNKTVDVLNGLLSSLYSYIGQPNGLATLDNTGRLPYTQLPLSAVEYKGAWNANTNTPTLASGTGTFGDEYIVSVQGTQNIGEGSVTYRVGDRVIYNGSIWQRIPASSVRTVNTKTPDANGNVTVNATDIVTPDVYGYDVTDLGKVWKEALYATNFSQVSTIKFANGIWVAGTDEGIEYSTNGDSWISSVYYKCNSVFYANGMWVAGCNIHGLWWSRDGKSWTENTVVGGNFYLVYNANELWIAGGSSGIWWSDDGKTWTQSNITSSSGGYNYAFYYKWTYNGSQISRWVIASASGLLVSSDGKTWTRVNATSMYSFNFVSALYNNASFPSPPSVIWVAGSDTGIWTSNDGETWTESNSFTSKANCIISVEVNDTSHVRPYNLHVMGGNGGLWWSTDGVTWTRGTGAITGVNFTAIDYYYGIWVAVGNNKNIWWSTDGKAWTQCTGVYKGVDFTTISSGNGKFVAGGDNSSYSGSSQGKAMWLSEGSETNNVKAILDWLIYAVDNIID